MESFCVWEISTQYSYKVILSVPKLLLLRNGLICWVFCSWTSYYYFSGVWRIRSTRTFPVYSSNDQLIFLPDLHSYCRHCWKPLGDLVSADTLPVDKERTNSRSSIFGTRIFFPTKVGYCCVVRYFVGGHSRWFKARKMAPSLENGTRVWF